MKNNIKKRILITAVSNKDPYNPNDYSDGSVLAILRKYKNDNIKIDKIYIYLTLETAIKEIVGKNYYTAITNLYPNIEINYIPEGIIEEVKEKIAENCSIENIPENDIAEIYFSKLKDFDYKIAVKDAHKYGKLYGELNKLIDRLKEFEKEPYEVIFNLSSGSSAMESDIYMTAITTKEINSKMIQVASPKKGSNYDLKLVNVDKNSLDILSKEEEIRIKNNGSRVTEELMVNTQKIILLESIEDSFKKRDFAGVYNSLVAYENIITNKDIIRYAKNLYYRYIGNSKEAENGIYDGNIKKEELYPIRDNTPNNNIKVVSQFMFTLERLNIMKVKAEREEINDWLLIAESTIEALYKKILYNTCGFDTESILNDRNKIIIKIKEGFNIGDGNKRAEKSYYADTLNIKLWNNKNYNMLLINGIPITNYIKNDYLIKPILERNGNYINAIVLKELLLNVWKNTNRNSKFQNSILVLDELREYRNLAAHTEEFITREILNNGFNEGIKKTNKRRKFENESELTLKYTAPVNAIKEAEDIIYEILLEIMPKEYTSIQKKDSEYNTILDQELDVYNKIENNIKTLLRNEII